MTGSKSEGAALQTTVGGRQQALIQQQQQREIAEVQSKILIARATPRDRDEAKERILFECEQPDLAKEALYSYVKGGKEITGETIRLAETIALNWGNLEFGVREIEQREDESSVESYAWDLERNVTQRKTFQVSHYIKAYGQLKKLTDPRELYELCANNGARRMRACILGLIPADVKKAAVAKCEETLKKTVVITDELKANIVRSFAEFGVTKEMIEKRIQRKFSSLTPASVLMLGKIINSLKEGMSTPDEWFDIVEPQKTGDDGKGLSLSDVKGQTPPPDDSKDDKPKGGTKSRGSKSDDKSKSGLFKD